MSELFIQRPITTTLIMAGIVLFGLIGYRALPVSDLPNVDYPTIQVTAEFPGGSPETMASSVATPLERQFSTIAGLSTVSSTSTLGNTQITLQFDLSRNIDAAAQDVQTAISRAAVRQLPPGMPSQPTLKKVNPADQPIVYLMVSSPTLAAFAGKRVCRHVAGAEALNDQRCGSGAGHRRAEICRARAARSVGAGQPRHRHRRRCDCLTARQHKSSGGHALWHSSEPDSPGQRAVNKCRRISSTDRCLSQRRARDVCATSAMSSTASRTIDWRAATTVNR